MMFNGNTRDTLVDSLVDISCAIIGADREEMLASAKESGTDPVRFALGTLADYLSEEDGGSIGSGGGGPLITNLSVGQNELTCDKTARQIFAAANTVGVIFIGELPINPGQADSPVVQSVFNLVDAQCEIDEETDDEYYEFQAGRNIALYATSPDAYPTSTVPGSDGEEESHQ